MKSHHGDASALSKLAAAGEAKLKIGLTHKGRIGKHSTGLVDYSAGVGSEDLWGSEPKAAKAKAKKAPVADSLGMAAVYVMGKKKLSRKGPNERNVSKALVAVDLPHGGTSYNPDAEQHQEVLGKALAFERRRVDVKQDRAAPLVTDRSELLESVLVGDSDSDDSDSEEEGDNFLGITKKRDKYTKAERNRQKRTKALLVNQKIATSNKKLLNEVGQAGTTTKQILKKTKEDRKEKERRDKVLAEERAKPLGENVEEKALERDPLRAPMMSVALSNELPSANPTGSGIGGMRTMKPKGSLVSERLSSLGLRQGVNLKSQREFKKKEGKKRRGLNKHKSEAHLL